MLHIIKTLNYKNITILKITLNTIAVYYKLLLILILLKMKVQCDKCGYEWDYKGLSTYYATCPMCIRKVKLNNEEDKKK